MTEAEQVGARTQDQFKQTLRDILNASAATMAAEPNEEIDQARENLIASSTQMISARTWKEYADNLEHVAPARDRWLNSIAGPVSSIKKETPLPNYAGTRAGIMSSIKMNALALRSGGRLPTTRTPASGTTVPSAPDAELERRIKAQSELLCKRLALKM